MKAYKREKIGYVAGIKYNSEGVIIDWLYGKHGLESFAPKHCHVFKTEGGARRHLKKFEPHIGKPFIREFFREVTL